MKKIFLIAGLLVFVLGIVGLVHPEFTYHKTEEVAHVGPVRATVNEEKTVTVPAVVAVLLVVAGVGLIVLAVKSRNYAG
jgi:hypothetical protein